MDLELLTKDVLIVLLFLIPGYLGFITFIAFLRSFFRTFRFKPSTIAPTTKIIASIIWSMIPFYALYHVTNFYQMLETFDYIKLIIVIFMALIFAELLAVLIFIVISLLTLIRALYSFFFTKKNLSPNKSNRITIRRWLTIWEDCRLGYEILSNKMYRSIILSAKRKDKVKIKLKGGDIIEGLIILNKEKIIGEELLIKNKKESAIINTGDIEYLKILK